MVKRWVMLCPLIGLLSACAAVPTGPSVMVLPGVGKPFDQFQVDDMVCRQFGPAGACEQNVTVLNESLPFGEQRLRFIERHAFQRPRGGLAEILLHLIDVCEDRQHVGTQLRRE